MANYGIRYGVGLRKRYDSVKADKQRRYKCDLCGKVTIRRVSNGIWHCRHCNATFAGGAYTFKTTGGETAARMLTKPKA
ncbi:MAG: 50S ribosomal protein L37ae [Candidatus Micrarchaeota archaeon]|nr:50S ribosomal protein L37ae [Candidatus Micrarchaeota archaeon]